MSLQQKIEYNITNVPPAGKYHVIHPEYNSESLSKIQLTKAIAKVILLGDSNVGKTCLASSIVSGEFRENYQPTVGAQFIKCEMTFNNTKLLCQIWDLAGQEEYSTVSMHYCRGADIVLFCFSLDEKTSFQHLNKWKSKLLDATNNYAALFLVGCKSDLPTSISDEEIKTFCQSNEMEYFVTSSKNKSNTKELMRRVGFYAALHVQQKKESLNKPKITIDSEVTPEGEATTEKSQKKGCC